MTDFRLAPGAREDVTHGFPTLRWEVAEADAPLPPPVFFEAGAGHSISNTGDAEYREIVFELMAGGEPRHSDEDVRSLGGSARYDPHIGTAVSFENRLLRAVELRLAPGAGEAEQLHQHTLDYGLVFLGETAIDLWRPGPEGAAEAAVLGWELPDGFAMWKPMPNGGYESEHGQPVEYSMHSITNARKDAWCRCYQVEVK